MAVAAAAAVVLSPAVAVPAAAAVDADGLQQFYTQTLTWKPCESLPSSPVTLSCTTVMVPMDYRRPDGPRETLDLSRRLAGDRGNRLGVLITVPGGPGGSSLDAAQNSSYDGLAGRYDIIGLDPRGLAQSDPLLCEGSAVPRYGLNRPTEEEMRAFTEQIRRHDQGCERLSSARRPYLTTANNARDLDVVRAVLGEPKLNLMGESYGTYVTAVYGTLFPQRLNRSVLDSAVHPRWLWREMLRQESIAQRKVAEVWMAWVAEHDAAYHLGTSKDAVHATIERMRAQLEAQPVDGASADGLDGVVGFTSDVASWDFFAQIVSDIRTAIEAGDAIPGDVTRAMAAQQAAAEDEPSFDDGVWESTLCEAEWPRNLNTYFADMRLFSQRYPYGWGASGAAPHECTFGSVKRVEPLVALRRDGYQTGLVVQQEFDVQTPYEGGPAMADLLGHRLVTVRGDGLHVSYGWNSCVTATVDDYFLRGTLPRAGAQCAGAQPPEVPVDRQPSLDERTRSFQNDRRRTPA